MPLGPYLQRELSFVLRSVESRDALLATFAEAVSPLLPGVDRDALYRLLLERESQSPTSTAEGVAFPHAVAPQIDRTFVGVAKLQRGVDFGRPGHPPADLVFCMVGNSSTPWEHVRLLARLARICRTEQGRATLRAADTAQQLYDALLAEDRLHA